MGRILLLMIVLVTFLTSACGNLQGQGEKLAVLNWEKAVQSHSAAAQLASGKEKLAQLTVKKQTYEERYSVQLQCLEDLERLKNVSRQSYLIADNNTRLVEYTSKEDYLYRNFCQRLEQEAEAKYGPARAAIEEQAKYDLFNLQMQLRVLQLRPKRRSRLEEKFTEAREDRENDLAAWEQQRQDYCAQELETYQEKMQQRIAAEEQRLYQTAAGEQGTAVQKIQHAPAYIKKIFTDLDAEISQQQEKNNKLENEITQELQDAAAVIAQRKGYVLVLKDYKVNVHAVDITDEVIQEIQKKDK